MKNYLVIGASSGIGQQVANQLAAENAMVYATFNKNERKDQENIKFQSFDVLDNSTTLTELPDTLDGLVYCPGSINLAPFHRIKTEAFEADIKLQVIGAIRVIQEVLPKLKAAEASSIVLYSTVAVGSGFNFHSQVATSKAALEGLARSLAAEFAPKIRVNVIAPSIIDTPLASRFLNSDDKKAANNKKHPLNRIGNTADIAELTTFLLSDKSSWITGQTMNIDGGLSTLKV